MLSAVGAVPTPRQTADLDRGMRATGGAATGGELTEAGAVALALDLGDRLGADSPAHARTT